MSDVQTLAGEATADCKGASGRVVPVIDRNHCEAKAGCVAVPINVSYCVTGIAAGSCVGSNTTLSSALTGVATPGVSLTYTYSATCAPGATNITLAP